MVWAKHPHSSVCETKVDRELLDPSADTGVNYTEGLFYMQVLFGASLALTLSLLNTGEREKCTHLLVGNVATAGQRTLISNSSFSIFCVPVFSVHHWIYRTSSNSSQSISSFLFSLRWNFLNNMLNSINKGIKLQCICFFCMYFGYQKHALREIAFLSHLTRGQSSWSTEVDALNMMQVSSNDVSIFARNPFFQYFSIGSVWCQTE